MEKISISDALDIIKEMEEVIAIINEKIGE